MKKVRILIAVSLMMVSASLIAQQRVVSGILEDLTFTDIGGNIHRPYDYLEAGKVVIIDIFATWCPPCWDFHQSGHLQSIYETYGPDGTDQLMVFYLEGDLNTYMDDINGLGSNTLGNYVDCSPYPLIENHVFPFDIGVSNFPSILYICPDKEIFEIGQLSFDEISNLLDNTCPVPSNTNNLDLLYFSSDDTAECGSHDYLPTVIVQNNGTNDISHISLNYKVNGSTIADSIGFDVFLDTYETIELPLPVNPLEHTSTFEVSVNTVNETSDSNDSRDTVTLIKPFFYATSHELEIQIQTDNFGFETFWKIENENGATVAWGGNELVIPGAQQGLTVLSQSDNLYPNNQTVYDFIFLNDLGCYTFTILDDWGDGFCCYTGPTAGFNIFDSYGNSVIKNKTFLDEYSIAFELNLTTTSTIDASTNTPVLAYPNPASSILNIDFEAKNNSNAEFAIINLQGKTLASFTQQIQSGSNQISIDISELNNGSYFLVNQNGEDKMVVSFQVLHP